MFKYRVLSYDNGKEYDESGVVTRGQTFEQAMAVVESYYGDTLVKAELEWIDIEGDLIPETDVEEIFAEKIEKKVQERMSKEIIKVTHYDTGLQSAEKARSACNCVETPISSFTYGTMN